MRKIFPRSLGVFQLMALLLISLLLFTACGSSAPPEPTPSQAEEESGSADAAQDTETADETESTDASEPAEESGAEMAEMVSCSGELPIVGKGPNGETATPLDTLSLTDEDIEKIKAGDYKVAISMHQMSSDWPILQVAGITDKMNEFGIEVIAVTDGEFKAEKQIADIESLIELDPDLIFMIPVDNDGLANVSKSIGENGIDLVLIDSKPTGLEPGVDYLGLGASDNYAIGADAAKIIAEELGGQGKVALLRWGFHVFQTEQRREGALDVFAQYPDIEIIYDEDVNSVEESTEVCENIMTRFPDTNAFWTPWDGPGTACMQAITNLGHGDDVIVTTVDLSNDSGLWIARDSALKGTAAQHPYDQGVAESMIALYALAGKEVPPYVVVPGRRVVRENVVCSMETVFHTPPDQDIIDLAGPQQDVEVEATTSSASEPAEESSVEMEEMMACSGELPIVGKGPNGETATPLDTLSLTPEDIEKIEAGDYTVAISMHQMSSDWPILQVAGITDKMNEFGIEVIAVTDGEFKAEKQIADIESLIELGPDLIFMIPVDNDGLANVSKSIGENGIDLVLIDSKPTGLEPGVDYLGLGASDNYAIGADAAEIIAEELGGQGKVALLRWGFHVFQTEQRREGALSVFAQYPDIEIIYDEDVNSVEESTEVCENIMTRFPDTNAFWTPWDGPGTACMQAITNLGHGDDVVVTTVDLSNDSGLWIARDSALKGTAAQHPYDQGVAESMIALYALAGKEVPPYVVVPGRRVVRENVVCSMETVFHTPPDQDIIDLAGPQQDVEVNK